MAVRDRIPINVPRGGPKANVVRPSFEVIRPRKSSSIPATYRLRSLARRKEITQTFGGTDASEQAVEAGLRWLARHQNVEGYWDADAFGAGQVVVDENRFDQQRVGIHADTGLTALAVLAFLGAGYTHEEGRYSGVVDRALRWLVRQQRRDGFLGGNATPYAKMYCHAMVTYALAEAYGMQSDPTTDTQLRQPLSRGIAYILDNQNPQDGGWRYLKVQRSDTSICLQNSASAVIDRVAG